MNPWINDALSLACLVILIAVFTLGAVAAGVPYQ